MDGWQGCHVLSWTPPSSIRQCEGVCGWKQAVVCHAQAGGRLWASPWRRRMTDSRARRRNPPVFRWKVTWPRCGKFSRLPRNLLEVMLNSHSAQCPDQSINQTGRQLINQVCTYPFTLQGNCGNALPTGQSAVIQKNKSNIHPSECMDVFKMNVEHF